MPLPPFMLHPSSKRAQACRDRRGVDATQARVPRIVRLWKSHEARGTLLLYPAPTGYEPRLEFLERSGE